MTALELKTYIFENNKIEYILEKIGCHSIVFHSSREYYSAANKNGNNDTAINIRNNIYLNYINYTRGVSSEDQEDLISLVQYNMSMDFLSAMKYLHKLLGLEYRFEKNHKPEKPKEDPLSIFKRFASGKPRCNVLDFNPMDESILNDYIPHVHIDWFREGIMPWTAKKFQISYSYRWKRIIIPHRYWMNGQLIGINARTTVNNYDELGIKKYFLTEGMNKSINLYGLREHYEDIQQVGYVVIYESEKSVLKRDSLNDCTGVALSGHSMSEEQVRILLGLKVTEIVIAMDKDVPIEEVWNMCEKFYHIRKVSFIYDTHDLLGDKDSPADAKNKIYNYLYKYRITYDEEYHKKYIKSLCKK